MIEIDGAYGEGGGQVLRTALFASLLTGRPFRMRSIRGNRREPGLKYQQLRLLQVVKQMSGSAVFGACEGSKEVLFYPRTIRGGRYEAFCEKPVALTLILQSLVPIALLAEHPVTIQARGGTDFSSSMTYDYLCEVLLPHFVGVELRLLSRSFYPRFDGEIQANINQRKAPPINLTRHPLTRSIKAFIVTSGPSAESLVKQLQSGADSILEHCHYLIDYSTEPCKTGPPGGSITLVAYCVNGERLGSHKVMRAGDDPKEVGMEAAKMLREEIDSGCPVDRHAGDNLIVWLLIRGGKIRPSLLTNHMLTNVWVCEQFLGSCIKSSGGIVSVDKPSTRPLLGYFQ